MAKAIRSVRPSGGRSTRRTPSSRPARATRSRASTATSTAWAGPIDRRGRRGLRPAARLGRRPGKGPGAGARSARRLRQNEDGGRARAERSGRPRVVHGRRAAVRSEEVSRGGRGVRQGGRPGGRHADRARRDVHARPRATSSTTATSRPATPTTSWPTSIPSTRYLDKLIDREWEIARYLEAYANAHYDGPMTPNAWDKTRPWFDTIGHAIKTYENIRMNDPTGPRADDAIMATANIYFRARALRRRRLPLHAAAARVSAERVPIRGPSARSAVEAAQVPGRRLRRHAARRGPAAGQAAPHEVRRPAQRRRTRAAARP